MKVKMLNFTAKWCSTCHVIETMLEKEVIPKYQDKVEFIKTDVEEDEKTTNQYDILSVPTLIILSDGRKLWRKSGTISKNEVMKALNKELTKWAYPSV